MDAPARYALIPAYEPDEKLPALARALREAGFSVVVVDDGSGPAYAELFERTAPYARVLRHKTNRGKGRALKTGLAVIAAEAPPAASVVTLDSDGQHTPEDALRVCAAAESAPGGLTLGSRALKAGTPLRSRFGNGVTRLVFRLTSGVCVHDTQTGLRAFRAALIPALLDVSGERYEFEMNMLLSCAENGVPIRETPIQTLYFNKNAGSHFRTVADSWLVYGGLLKFAASSFGCFALDFGLYSLLNLLTAGLGAAAVPLSNIAARIVSAAVNYGVNRRFVFHSRKSVLRTAPQYALLAAGILAGNTLVLGLLTGRAGLDRYAAKLLTELLFFLVSWFVQNRLIFSKKDARS